MSTRFTSERLITLLSEASVLLSAGMTTGDGLSLLFPGRRDVSMADREHCLALPIG